MGASKDKFGIKTKLPNGNVAGRVLPVKIHDLDDSDIQLLESVLGGVVRGIEFIFKSAGVNRPLTPTDYPEKNLYQTFYRDQIEVLRQSEVLAQKGYFPPVEMAIRYAMVNQPDRAMDWIEKGFEEHDPGMPYITTHCMLCEPLFDNPRFISIVHKMNLPLPKK